MSNQNLVNKVPNYPEIRHKVEKTLQGELHIYDTMLDKTRWHEIKFVIEQDKPEQFEEFSRKAVEEIHKKYASLITAHDEVTVKKLDQNKYELSYDGMTAIYTKDGEVNHLKFNNLESDIFQDTRKSKIHKVASELSRNV